MVFLDGGDYLNEYYIVSEAESRKLLNVPEVVGYEVYDCLIPSTSQMLYYLKEQKKVTTANILSILRGALNYPLEESCYRDHGTKLRNIIIFTIGGTATPNFARFAKDAKSGTIATVVAFFIGNSLMFFFGAIAYIFVGGNECIDS